MQIPDTDCQYFGFRGLDKQQHQRPCKDKDAQADDQAENHGAPDGAFHAGLNAFLLFGAEILGGKGGKCISEILHRHIGEGIDLYGGGKGCHYRGAEAVDQALHHENPQIHD